MNVQNLFHNKVTQNAGWLIGGKIAHALLTFAVGVLTSRYLGPKNYGLINYAAAYTTFFFSLCTLGINSIIVKNFVDNPNEEGETLGTALLLKGISSLISALIIIVVVSIADADEPLTRVVVALCNIGLIFQIFETYNYWFQAHLKSKYTAIASTLAYIAVSVYKLVLLALGKSVEWFALATSVDYIVVAIILFAAYKKQKGPALSFSIAKARELLDKSRHFILAGLMVSIYGSTDKFMLKHMLDEAAVGHYSIAVTMSNMWVFILSAIIDSLSPVIMRQRSVNLRQYEKYNRLEYAIVFYLSLFVSIGYMLFGDFAIKLLYGEAYAPAAAPMKVIAWYVAFSYLGVARNAWMVCEDKQRYLGRLYMGAALTNVALNAVLIPVWGAVGAALASLVTQISTILVFPALIKDLRPNVKLMLQAITFKDLRER